MARREIVPASQSMNNPRLIGKRYAATQGAIVYHGSSWSIWHGQAFFAAKVASMPLRLEEPALSFGTIDPTAEIGLSRRGHQQIRRYRIGFIAALQ